MEPIQELYANFAILKVNKRAVKFVELLNERRADGEPFIEVEQYMDQIGNELAEEFKDLIPPDNLAEKIKRFKSDVGDEVWQDVKNNPALQEIVEAHIVSQSQSLFNIAIQRLLTLFAEADQILVEEGDDDPLTAEDVKYAFFGGQQFLM